jgi:hypothetical protein
MSIESFLFKKIEVWVLILVFIMGIVFSVIFGSAVRHQLQGGKMLGQFGYYIESIASFPQMVRDVINGKGSRFDLLAREQRFGDSNGFNFTYQPNDGKEAEYLLLNRYDGDLGHSVSELVDLKSQKKIHTWSFNKIDDLWTKSTLKFQNQDLPIDKSTERYRNQHAYLVKSGRIFVGEGPLISIDLDSSLNIINDSVEFHHSLEADEDGDFWAPIRIKPKTVKLGNNEFHDNGVMKLSQSGEVKFKRSVMSILDTNNLGYLIFGAGEHNANNNDPIHLNDIQPVKSNSKYWKKGDVFLSIRNLSLVLLYRPGTNKVLWFKQGPWLHQHDVNVINDHEISIYNNNVKLSTKEFKVDGVNDIFIYNFNSKLTSSPWKNIFKKFDIRTITEGRGKLFHDEIFIEESDYGRLLYISKKQGLLWSYYNRAKDGNIYRINWSRIIPREIGDKIKKDLLTIKG